MINEKIYFILYCLFFSLHAPVLSMEMCFSTSCQTIGIRGANISALAVSPDENYIAIGKIDGFVDIRSLKTWDVVNVLHAHTGVVRSISISSENFIASGGDDTRVRIWGIEKKEIIRTFFGHEYAVYGLSWLPNSNVIISTDYKKNQIVWNANTGKEVVRVNRDDINPNAVYISNYMVRKTIHTCLGHTDEVCCVCRSQDRHYIASASLDNTIRVWNSEDGKPMHVFSQHKDTVSHIAWSPDNRHIVSGSSDGTVRVWSVKRTDPVYILGNYTDEIWHVGYSPDNQFIAFITKDCTLRICRNPITQQQYIYKQLETTLDYLPNDILSCIIEFLPLTELKIYIHQAYMACWFHDGKLLIADKNNIHVCRISDVFKEKEKCIKKQDEKTWCIVL